ncbi:MAG: DNA-directed RNA polymerase [Candidatus Diapherotrites archaeon]|uniref:DNA-directed RNA polymerase subunit Rpo7 n=1 Tax=Candidatus Iainarchaeum sp. TaxID=3101447 RepID=A0A7J4IS75_9ARCH|nr:MAG: DNA-directed RNA polymerase subunit E' [archaeon GW2011_AR10]MBS3059583.1 DNA-directed RNA polymerase [Candidatus Diapherotrites archaeon]HIH08373.1 DNA-directed RNA polymerase [Candidatus Diapherotrites archaeon]
MFRLYSIKDTVRVPPSKLGENLKATILKSIQEEYEGLLDEDLGIVVAVTEIESVGEGKIVPGDGAVYYDADIKMLIYKPEMHEVVEGVVSEITEFGAFVKIGAIEGLVHVSQIMDDYINYDAKAPCFVGKESLKKLQVNDTVLARIVTISLKGNISSSKIGLTMRQEGLGKKDWKKIDEKAKKKKGEEIKKKPAEKKEGKK